MSVRMLRILYTPPEDISAESGHQIQTATEAAAVLAPYLADQVVEVFGVLCLTTTSNVIAYHEISRGSLNATIVHPREVFKAAVLCNAASVILSHNHPSGDPNPSPEDQALTRRLCEAGHLLGIEVLDHIVIGHDGRFCSHRERGCL